MRSFGTAHVSGTAVFCKERGEQIQCGANVDLEVRELDLGQGCKARECARTRNLEGAVLKFRRFAERRRVQ